MVLYVICVHENFFLTEEKPSADSQLRICRVFQCILSIVEGNEGVMMLWLFLNSFIPLALSSNARRSITFALLLHFLHYVIVMPPAKSIVLRDQVFPLIVVYCLLLLVKNKLFQASFIDKNCSGQV